MENQAAAVESGVPALSQGERVIDVFVAPSKTFQDVRRSTSWWLPYLLIVLCSYGLMFGISKRVGWSQLAENMVHSNPKLEERMSSLPPDQAQLAKKRMQYGPMIALAANPVTNGIFLALIAAIMLATINFAFGGRATFAQVFCVTVYSWLILSVKNLLALILLFVGSSSAESFTMDQMVGTNPGYYIDTPGALKTLLGSLDIFQIWMLVVLGIGLSIVAGTKRSSGWLTAFGWWALIVLFRTAMAAVSS